MNDMECLTCIKRKTMFCPNSNECYETMNKPFYQNRIMLLEENTKLKERIDKAIEYIKNNMLYDSYTDDCIITPIPILEILKGENKVNE